MLATAEHTLTSKPPAGYLTKPLRDTPGARSGGAGVGRTSRVIQLSELTKTFGDRTLFDRVTWQIGDGDRVGLCGPNGAGKTTLLKMLAGLDEPDSGIVAKPADLTIGYLPQDGLTHRGPHGVRGGQQRVSAAARHEGGDARHRARLGGRLGAAG